MTATTPVPSKAAGNTLASSDWNTYLKGNIDKLLMNMHRVLTVAQFTALTTPEGTKGSVPPDEVYLEVDATNGVQWHLGYESGETTYKWRFLGGPPLYSEVATSETTASGTYAALSTAGPSIALPRAGDYDVTPGADMSNSNNNTTTFMSYDVGGTGAVDADAAVVIGGSVNEGVSAQKPRRKTALTSVTLTSKYRCLSATATISKRFLALTPVRIRHDA